MPTTVATTPTPQSTTLAGRNATSDEQARMDAAFAAYKAMRPASGLWPDTTEPGGPCTCMDLSCPGDHDAGDPAADTLAWADR